MIDSLIAITIRCLLAAAGTGVVVTWVWVVSRASARESILPGRLVDRSAVPPWDALTVLGAFLAYALLSMGLADLYQVATARVQARAHAHDFDHDPRAQPLAHDPAPGGVSNREQMGVHAVSEILLLAILPLTIRRTTGARWADFGASWVRWRGQVVLGLGAACMTIPVCFLVQGLAVRVWNSNEHKMATLIREEYSLGTAAISLLGAVVLAPATEELLFRALLQRWLIGLFHRVARSLDAISVVESMPDPDPPPGVSDPLEWDSSGKVSPLGWSLPTWLGILVTALGFAAVHAPQWPAPISLFVFAVVMGIVFQHSGSLIAAIIMHASLNAISTLVMILRAILGD